MAASESDPRRKRLWQTVFILFVLLVGGCILLAEIPFRRTVDRELHGALWDAWGAERGETDLRVRGTLTFQLGREPRFEGVLEVEGCDFTLEENGGFTLLQLSETPWSDLREGSLAYGLMGRDSLGRIYTDLSFRHVLILLPDRGRWMGYAAPAETQEEARALFWEHLPVTREPQ